MCKLLHLNFLPLHALGFHCTWVHIHCCHCCRKSELRNFFPLRLRFPLSTLFPRRQFLLPPAGNCGKIRNTESSSVSSWKHQAARYNKSSKYFWNKLQENMRRQHIPTPTRHRGEVEKQCGGQHIPKRFLPDPLQSSGPFFALSRTASNRVDNNI